MAMTLYDVMKAVDDLSPEERAQLRTYLDRYKKSADPFRIGTMDIDSLLDAARAMRNDMAEADFDAMLDAMNEEFIEPVDENEWHL